MILFVFCVTLDKSEVKMNFGYKSLIAVTLVCAGWCKGRSANSDNKGIVADSGVVVKPNPVDSVENSPQTIKLKPVTARKPQDVDNREDRPDADEDEADLDTLNNQEGGDSAEIENICKSVQELEYDAVRLIAMSESIEMNAYDDRASGKWTIGFGNITHPDGSPVKKGDKIENEEQLMYYFRAYFENRVAPNIQKYLPTWNKFNRQEKLALLDLFWNAGSGKLHTAAKKTKTGKFQAAKPSELANALNAYAENRTPENLDAVIKAMKGRQFISTKKKGIIPALQKRVAFRIKIFTGEIELNGDGPTSIDLDEAHLGAHYGAFKASDLQNLNFSKTKLETICDSINNCRSGLNFADTLEYKKVHSKPTYQQPKKQYKRRLSYRGR